MTENNLPMYVKIEELTKIIGLGRSRIYLLIGDEKLRAKKSGSCTLVEMQSVLEYMKSLPPAKIASSRKKVA